MGNQSSDDAIIAKWKSLHAAMQDYLAKKEPKEEDWKPYYEFLVQQLKEGMKTGKNVILTFAMCDAFGERSWMEQQVPGLRYIVLNVDSEEIVQRSLVRNKATLIAAGTSIEELWKSDLPDFQEMRDKYGD